MIMGGYGGLGIISQSCQVFTTTGTSTDTTGSANYWVPITQTTTGLGWNYQLVTNTSGSIYPASIYNYGNAQWQQSWQTEYVPTPEQAQEAIRQQAQQMEQFAQAQQEWTARAHTERQRVVSIRREGDARAEKLLTSMLDKDQLVMYLAHGYFEVPSGKWPRRRYRLTPKRAGNVIVIEGNDLQVESLCIHATRECPMGDHLLCQKLMIEGNEDLFRSTANITKITRRMAA